MAKMANWRRHAVEFKRWTVERMKTCENVGALARELKAGAGCYKDRKCA